MKHLEKLVLYKIFFIYIYIYIYIYVHVVNLLVWIINIIKSFLFFFWLNPNNSKWPLIAFKGAVAMNNKTRQKSNYILCHLLIASD